MDARQLNDLTQRVEQAGERVVAVMRRIDNALADLTATEAFEVVERSIASADAPQPARAVLAKRSHGNEYSRFIIGAAALITAAVFVHNARKR